MDTHQNIQGYLNAALHYVYPNTLIVRTRREPDLLSYFESSSEEIAYKTYWEAYFDGRQ